MVRVDPIFISNEPEDEKNPRYVVSRLINTPQEAEDEPQVPEDRPTYVAYKAPEESGGGSTGNNHPSS